MKKINELIIPISKLELWRRIHHVTQNGLAQRCKVQQAGISAFENIRIPLSIPARKKIASLTKNPEYTYSLNEEELCAKYKNHQYDWSDTIITLEYLQNIKLRTIT
jgi:hypothetical protein